MEDDSLAQDRALAKRLFDTWQPFFGRFGRLTPVQRVAIGPVLDGGNVLVCSGTGTGKTEAVCAPLVERSLSPRNAWTILYVSPTRALVNDLYERLLGPLHQLSLRIARRTGDHKEPAADANVLLTTPESFDSLLSRDRAARGLVHRISAVVLDEIHLIDGTGRGEQVRWLLHRLRRAQAGLVPNSGSAGPQVVALSATVADSDAVVGRYMLGALTIAVPGARDIRVVAVDSALPTPESALPLYLEQLPAPEKVLLFCNSRKRVDSLSMRLREALAKLNYVVFAHHGSLSMVEREKAETMAKSRDRIVIVSTSTLEIGIDIGDIDLIVLDGPPPDVAAFLQRIGRGNRRTGFTRVMLCSASAREAVIQAAMLRAARNGELGVRTVGGNTAVARQQIASLILAADARSVARGDLLPVLSECLPNVKVAHLLDHFVNAGEFDEDAAGIRLSEGWKDLASTGGIHSNIESIRGSSVVDDESGAFLGHDVVFKSGTGLHLGGNLLRVREWGDFRIAVRHTKRESEAQGEWGYVGRRWVEGRGQPEAVRDYLEIPPNVWPVITDGDNSYVFHFGGGPRRAILELILHSYDQSSFMARVNAWFLAEPGIVQGRPLWLEHPAALAIHVAISARLGAVEAALGRPKSSASLPMDLRIAEAREWLDLDNELDLIAQCDWRPAEDFLDGDAIDILWSLRGATV